MTRSGAARAGGVWGTFRASPGEAPAPFPCLGFGCSRAIKGSVGRALAPGPRCLRVPEHPGERLPGMRAEPMDSVLGVSPDHCCPVRVPPALGNTPTPAPAGAQGIPRPVLRGSSSRCPLSPGRALLAPSPGLSWGLRSCFDPVPPSVSGSVWHGRGCGCQDQEPRGQERLVGAESMETNPGWSHAVNPSLGMLGGASRGGMGQQEPGQRGRSSKAHPHPCREEQRAAVSPCRG